MSRSSPIDLTSHSCNHNSISCESSSYASKAGYQRPTLQKRQAATTPQGRTKKGLESVDDQFPAPLILPGDDLDIDPTCPPQSLRSWIQEKHRNEITTERRTIYVAAPPHIGSAVSFMKAWSKPELPKTPVLGPPDISDLVDYLSAFYHGLPVKQLPPSTLSFTTRETTGKLKRKRTNTAEPSFVGLNTSTNCIRIRARAPKDGIFLGQLNLDDLLDAAIDMLPADAYALLLLVNHDLYEDEEDEFVCGRAYGGSRVAVISTARYHPSLDSRQNIDREHLWPASHCVDYMQSCCANASTSTSRSRSKNLTKNSESLPGSAQVHEPLQAALDAHKSMSSTEPSLSGLWITRVCRTSAHELGHCFGIGHCIYYACSMQGTCSLMEDTRQPPYLCPVDLAKVLTATGTTAKERYEALLDFSQKEKHKNTHMFVAYGAWIRQRLVEIGRNET